MIILSLEIVAVGLPEFYPMMAGQSAGLISNLPSASEVVRDL